MGDCHVVVHAGCRHCHCLPVPFVLPLLPLPFPGWSLGVRHRCCSWSLRCFFLGDCMRASLTVVRSCMISSVMIGNVSFCLIRIAMSQANVSQRVLICARRVLFLRTSVVNQSQYLMTDFSVPNLMRIHAHLTASMPSRIIEMTSQSGGSLVTNCCLLSTMRRLSRSSFLRLALTVPREVKTRCDMISPSVTAV